MGDSRRRSLHPLLCSSTVGSGLAGNEKSFRVYLMGDSDPVSYTHLDVYKRQAVVNLTGECVWRKEEYFDEIRVESFESVLDDVIGRFPETGLLAFGLPGEVVNDVVTIHDYEALIGPDFMAHYKERCV